MLKRIFSLVAVMFFLSGCAVSPQHVQNTAVGAGLGAIAGAIIGNNSESAKRGAILGGTIGAILPVHQQGHPQAVSGYPHRQLHPQGVLGTCRLTNGVVVSAHSEAHCYQQEAQMQAHQRAQQRGWNQSINPQVYGQQPGLIPPDAVCGPDALRMQCTSLPVPGTNCRRCS